METILQNLESVFFSLYVIVFLISIIRFPLYRNTALKFLPVILFATMATEYFGDYLKDLGNKPINFAVFNLYYLMHFSLFFYIFMKMIENSGFKKNIKIGYGIFLLFYLSDLFFTGFFKDSFTIAYLAGASILIFCIILYYISILQSSLVFVVKNDLLFWVSVGLFLFYIGYLPIKIIKTWFYKPDSFFNLLLILQFSLIIIMYLCFLTGFLWMKKRS